MEHYSYVEVLVKSKQTDKNISCYIDFTLKYVVLKINDIGNRASDKDIKIIFHVELLDVLKERPLVGS